MTAEPPVPDLAHVRGTALLAGDTREQYRQKIARITLDSMVQFVGLLDARGTVLEINKVALDAVGITLSDVEGKPFWTTFWWQVSDEINRELRDAITRASRGEFVRWDTEIFGRAGGKETIVIDASLMPVKDDQGNVVFIAAEGRDITAKKAYEREIARQREELAKLDELKTQFFANISHEFRTPLTLMMGPLEDALAQGDALSAADRGRLELAHRNSLRLLKLVNTLLDFSRIEAGRIQASYEPVDLAVLTADLGSVFRSAVERAGMKLVIDCPPLSEPVYVDREMWEKVVLNLLSNAFKFTFEGEIDVSLRRVDGNAQLTIRDTGTGIPAEEIPRLFERFHRVKGARGRSYEGSGIGLALVQELVKLHGGTVRVESEINRGSRFIVSIPLGKAHLPFNRIEAERTLASTSARTEAYVEEVLSWLPDAPRAATDEVSKRALGDLREDGSAGSAKASPHTVHHILLADDNADMRDYVRRLLFENGYEVEPVPDGLAALKAAQTHKPDLVLSDVMMPGLDGFGLLRELRAHPSLADIPIILLSARAGEEARIEGMQAGADDYLIKPFSARELLARVESHLKLARVRHEGAEALKYRTAEFEALLNRAPLGVYLVDADFRIREVNPAALPVFGDIPGGVIGRDFDEVIHILWEKNFADEVVRLFRHTLETGESYVTAERGEFRRDRRTTEHYEWRLDRIPLADGRYGVVCYFRNISQRVQAEKTRQLLLGELNHRVKNTLASVQAIAQQTLRSTKDPADFASRFSGRIQSLARVHSLLTDSTWQGADLNALIRDQLLQGSVDETRLTVRGPGVHLNPHAAVHLALMLHELGTNSVKYGSLSTGGGRVTVSWSVADDVLRLHWVERGGPPVSAPAKRGFGTRLIEQSARGEGGTAQMLSEAEGVTWEIVLPLPASSVSQTPQERAEPQWINPAMRKYDGGLSAKHRAPLAGRRLLVVEDEPLIALDLAASLEKAGAALAKTAGTQKEALEHIEQTQFDGALLDVNLHGQPVDNIAAALTRRNIPFVFVTGYGRDGLPNSFKHMSILAKPFSEEQLIQAVIALSATRHNVVQLKP